MDHTGKLYLGHIGKVPLYAAMESLFLLAYIYMIGGDLPGEKLVTLLLVFLLTIVLHELGHAVVAIGQGMSGVSITIGALGGYCSYVGDRHPYREFLISLTGPVTNLLIAWLSWILLTQLRFTDELLLFFLSQMYYWNLVLGILNLLPIYPLDGGQVALSLCRMAMRSELGARRFTLGLSVVTAFVAVGFLLVMNQGQISPITFGLAVVLLVTAFRDLR
jgi:Zn-dependent protease